MFLKVGFCCIFQEYYMLFWQAFELLEEKFDPIKPRCHVLFNGATMAEPIRHFYGASILGAPWLSLVSKSSLYSGLLELE